jgi:hypothetical protein
VCGRHCLLSLMMQRSLRVLRVSMGDDCFLVKIGDWKPDNGLEFCFIYGAMTSQCHCPDS